MKPTHESRHNHVVDYGNTDDAPGGHEFGCRRNVFRAWVRVAGGVIMAQYDARGARRDGRAKYCPHLDGADAVLSADGHHVRARQQDRE